MISILNIITRKKIDIWNTKYIDMSTRVGITRKIEDRTLSILWKRIRDTVRGIRRLVFDLPSELKLTYARCGLGVLTEVMESPFGGPFVVNFDTMMVALVAEFNNTGITCCQYVAIRDIIIVISGLSRMITEYEGERLGTNSPWAYVRMVPAHQYTPCRRIQECVDYEKNKHISAYSGY